MQPDNIANDYLKRNRISLLATGSEILQGETLDSNCQHFAHKIHQKGGILFQHLQTSDTLSEILQGVAYLLKHSDALIICGGLGPTSDDNTRFALSEYTQLPLTLNAQAWSHIKMRLKQFDLPLASSNRKQALFPSDATLYINSFGTACGCKVLWKNKTIFLLPGPPRECIPMFEQQVLPSLQKANFFYPFYSASWLTLGLSEGSISQEIDHLCEKEKTHTPAYCWEYPYLKITLESERPLQATLFKKMNQRLTAYTISTRNMDALQELQHALHNHAQPLLIIGDAAVEKVLQSIPLPLAYASKAPQSSPLYLKLIIQTIENNVILLRVEGYQNQDLCYSHQMQFPNRGPEIEQLLLHYLAWQSTCFLEQCQLSQK